MVEKRYTGLWWMGFWGRQERNEGFRYGRRRTHCVNKSAYMLVYEKWEGVRIMNINSGGIADLSVPIFWDRFFYFLRVFRKTKSERKNQYEKNISSDLRTAKGIGLTNYYENFRSFMQQRKDGQPFYFWYYHMLWVRHSHPLRAINRCILLS